MSSESSLSSPISFISEDFWEAGSVAHGRHETRRQGESPPPPCSSRVQETVLKIPTTRSTSQKQRKGHKKQAVTASQKSVAEQKIKRAEPPSSAQPTIEVSIPPETTKLSNPVGAKFTNTKRAEQYRTSAKKRKHRSPAGQFTGSPSENDPGRGPTCLLKGQHQLLKRQNDLLVLENSRITKELAKTLKDLRHANKKLNQTRNQYEEMLRAGILPPSENTEERINGISSFFSAELEKRDKEVNHKTAQIRELEMQLDSSRQLKHVLRDRTDGTHQSIPNFWDEMKVLQQNVSNAASYLSRAVCKDKLRRLVSSDADSTGLKALIKESLADDVHLLTSSPREALRATIFTFVRSRVFYSNCWAALHCEGYMLRGYQQVIENSTPNGTLEVIHQCAVQHMTEKDHVYRKSWVPAHVQEVQDAFMKIFAPVLDPTEPEGVELNLAGSLEQLLTDAFLFRAKCFPVRGTRYELAHFKPGDVFDPDIMKVAETGGQLVPKCRDEGLYRVRVCTHGAMMLHRVDETSFGVDAVESLGQAFAEGGIASAAEGRLISAKASVILQAISDIAQ
ncbi:uncharacterized protein BO95DRAFT_516795 [Aspergillus brunneoviolaceus CBS 621.78]|uniref:Uncharacterized protein n=1 Tax=Aspergillus brunneoviolaceus CBS 621.78 TaxID=1450534 RepID=A0ACD1G0N8_9EURO|nr:hypothetical protein BO95DRAFT_516795 [Aspergillus brunneoviolaceus CBS 621.78]RAH42838.1 hypothetical protein BO95DRAFT_516795 [Aspergillus brunneoviolaceus CBS 621.78]